MVQTIYIDPNTGNLGIGTTSPLTPLHIEGAGIFTGNVGIGTTIPLTKLDVNGNININSIFLDDGIETIPCISFKNDIDTGIFRSTTNNMSFTAAGVERARITTNGLRTYGDSSWYNTSLVYQGSIQPGSSSLTVESQGILYLDSVGVGTGAAYTLRSFSIYGYDTANAANVSVSSAGTLGRSTSSLRYKKDIITLEDTIADNILNCRPIKYKSKFPKESNPEWSYYGFIAEEVALIEPRLVTYDQNNEPDGVQYDRFIPLLLNIIQRQKNEINSLRTDYNNLIQTLQSKGILP